MNRSCMFSARRVRFMCTPSAASGSDRVWSPAIADSGVASRACPPTRAGRHRDLDKMSDNEGYNTRFRAQLGALDTPRPAQRVEAELPAQPAPLADPVKDMSADLNILLSAAELEAVNGSTGQPPAQHRKALSFTFLHAFQQKLR